MQEYFDQDPTLLHAFQEDAEFMNLHCEETDYIPGTSKERFQQTRANLKPHTNE